MNYDWIARDAARALQRISDVIESGIKIISGDIESASAKNEARESQNNAKDQIQTFLDRQETQTQADNAREARKEIRETNTQARDRVRLSVEILALGVGIIVAGANVLLWIQTKEATRIAAISADAAQKSAKASEEQTAATKISIDQTVASFQLDQRAWVGVVDVSVKFQVAAGRRFVWIGYVTNNGKTPSLQTKMLREWQFHGSRGIAVRRRYSRLRC
jgi:hypothetical protein